MGFLKLYMMDVNRWIERQFHVKTKVAYLSAMFARLATPLRMSILAITSGKVTVKVAALF